MMLILSPHMTSILCILINMKISHDVIRGLTGQPVATCLTEELAILNRAQERCVNSTSLSLLLPVKRGLLPVQRLNFAFALEKWSGVFIV